MSNRISGLERVRGVASGLALMSGAALIGLVAATTIVPAPASAQLFFSRRLPPGQIVTIVQSRGYTYPTYPYYRGDIYVVDANEPRGNRVRLVIDPNSGEIVERLLIRQQRVLPGPGFDDTYVRSGVPRIVNPSEEAVSGPRTERPRIKRAARRPAERPPETTVPGEVSAPAEPAPQAAIPKEAAPKENAPSEPIARPTRPVATPRATPAAPVAATPPAAVPSAAQAAAPADTPAAPATPERGTKANPRKVGPVLPPAVGVE